MPDVLTAGAEFAGFRIVREIGRGGMGLVYLAEQPSLGRFVALKLITPALAGDELFRQRFEREAHHAASIEHPNVIPIFEAGASGEHLYLAMRYVEGVDLGSYLREQGPLEPRVAAGVVEQIGAALDAAHAKALIHRDVKPANILIVAGDPGGHAYLTDFGLTKEHSADSGLTDTGAWVGTVDYVAPEQIQGGRVDARTDVYALSCVLYESLTGEIPFQGTAPQKMWAHMNNPPPEVRQMRTDVEPAFDDVIRRGLAKDPDERYPSAGDLGRAARAATIGTASPTPERSVATGAAATGVAATRPSGEPLAAAPTAAAPTPPATTGGDAVTQPLPGGQGGSSGRSRGLIVAALIAALALGVGAAALLMGQLEDDPQTPTVQQAAAPSGEEEEPESGAGGGGGQEGGSGGSGGSEPVSTFAPASYSAYTPADPAYAYSAEIPKGNGWSAPVESLPTGGGLLRTTVRGPEGAVLIIDRTPDEVPQLGGELRVHARGAPSGVRLSDRVRLQPEREHPGVQRQPLRGLPDRGRAGRRLRSAGGGAGPGAGHGGRRDRRQVDLRLSPARTQAPSAPGLSA